MSQSDVPREPSQPPGASRYARHHAAVGRSLRAAEVQLRAGNHAEALGWIRVVEAVGERLPDAHRAKLERLRRIIDASTTSSERSARPTDEAP